MNARKRKGARKQQRMVDKFKTPIPVDPILQEWLYRRVLIRRLFPIQTGEPHE